MRNYSLEAVERLLALKRCSVTRNKKTGHIVAVQFFPLPSTSSALEGTERLRKTAHIGQHYSYPHQVDNSGKKVWQFSKVLTPRDVNAEQFLQQVFRAVPISCLVIEEPEKIAA
jgi:hypothetical protein